MKRWNGVVVAALLFVPAVAQAQRPSNNMHTRSADVYLKEAREQQVLADRREVLEKALKAALEGTKADPNNSKPWFQAGQAYLQLGDLVGADSAFDRAEKMYPEYAAETDPLRQDAWITAYNAGVTALQANRIEDAKRALENADVIYQKRPEALVTLGSVHVQEGDLAKGEATFRRALSVLRGPERAKLKPEQKTSWEEDEIQVALRLANIYVDQGKFAEAEQVYKELLASQPNNTMARANLAVAMSRAGKTEEATVVYRELLQAQDLTDATLFRIGVGLFSARQYAESAEAFRRAAALNPHAHETLYNLANALFAYAGELDKATKADELRKINDEMLATTEKLHQLDPTNRNVLMMMAQSQRTLGELATGAAAQEWQKKTLTTLEKHKALPFEVSDINLVPNGDQVQVMGKVTNLNASAGAPLRFRFIVLDREGAQLSAEEITVTAPAKDESERFSATIATPQGATGWRYEIIS